MEQKNNMTEVTRVPQLVHVEGFLKEQEIEDILSSVKKVEKNKGRITVEGKNDGYRDVDIQILDGSKKGVDAIIKKVLTIIEHANLRFWNFSCKGITEDINVLTYKKGQQYKLHSDVLFDHLNTEHLNRKLSFIFQLSDDKDYTGGDVVLQADEMGEVKIDRQKGSLVFFPAFVPHKVYPIKSGVRKSVIGWVSGDAWK